MTPRPIMILWLAAAAALTGASSAFGQTDSITVGGLKWRPVEQGIADRSPLSTSTRAMPVDLRANTNFEQVYALDGKPNLFGAAPDYYMRQNGALVAVFPKSSYTAVGGGIDRVDVPAGTVYSIGGSLRQLTMVPGQQPEKTDPKRVPPTRVDRSANKQGAESAAQPGNPAQPSKTDKPVTRPDPNAIEQKSVSPVPSTVPPPAHDIKPVRSIWSDEEYRKERVGNLLDDAFKTKK